MYRSVTGYLPARYSLEETDFFNFTYQFNLRQIINQRVFDIMRIKGIVGKSLINNYKSSIINIPLLQIAACFLLCST